MGRPALDYSYAMKHDPRRAPTWRYERVRRLLAEKKPVHPQQDDDFVKRLRLFYLDKSRLQKTLDADELNRALAAKHTYVWEADKIFCNGRQDRTRYTVEASLLAGQTIQEIADSRSVTPEGVKWYEQLFFNISDRLQNKSYIANEVLGPAFMAGLGNRSPELTAKYFGYFGGPLILNLILDAFDNYLPAPKEPRELGTWLDHQIRLRLKTQALISSTFLEPNNFNIRTLMESYVALVSLQQKEQESSGDDNLVNKAVELFLKTTQIPIGNVADDLLLKSPKPYSELEITPRVAHNRAIAQGQSVPLLQDHASETWVSPKNRTEEHLRYNDGNQDQPANDGQAPQSD